MTGDSHPFLLSDRTFFNSPLLRHNILTKGVITLTYSVHNDTKSGCNEIRYIHSLVAGKGLEPLTSGL